MQIVASSFTFTIFSVPGSYETGASAINNLNQIVGSDTRSIPIGTTVIDGFVYQNGNLTTLEFTSPVTSLTGINNLGQIAGWASGPPTGFLYESGTFTVIGSDFIVGLNDVGDILGYGMAGSYVSRGGTLSPVAFPGACGTSASDINNSGEIVGYYTDCSSHAMHAFVDIAGLYSSFDVPGAVDTQAFGLNNLGQIVGTYTSSGIPGTAHGFVYSGGTFQTLDDPGAVFTEPYGINDAGIVVGETSCPGLNGCAFFATPSDASVPEPGSFALLAVALLVTGFVRRR
jgi:probable HAF family extracellular repeat protein